MARSRNGGGKDFSDDAKKVEGNEKASQRKKLAQAAATAAALGAAALAPNVIAGQRVEEKDSALDPKHGIAPVEDLAAQVESQDAAQLVGATDADAEQAQSESTDSQAKQPEAQSDVAASESSEDVSAASGEGAAGSDNMMLAQANQASPTGAAAAAPQAAGAGEAAGGAAGAEGAAGGVAAAQIAPIAVAGVGVAAAAGGGGAGAVGATVAPALPGGAGFAAKGPLNNARVFADLNGDGVWQSNEPFTMTKADGTYQFASGTTIPSNVKLVVTGGTYTGPDGNPKAFTGTLSAPPGGGAITPFSTLAASGIDPAVLREMLGGRDPNSLTLSDFDSPDDGLEQAGTAMFDLLSSGKTMAQIITTLQTANSLGLDLTDPAAIESALDLTGTAGLTAANIARINYAADKGATVEFDSSGTFVAYHISETNFALLNGSGDYFGSLLAGANAGTLVFDVEGTLLGASGADIKFSTLNALGVDKVVTDDFAPFLHIRAGDADAAPGFTLDDSNTAPYGAVHGTDLSAGELTNISSLGVTSETSSQIAGHIGGSGWDDPLGHDV